LLHSGTKPEPLSASDLRQAIEDAISGKKGVFVYDPDILFPKLASHDVSIQDLLHVCHTWQTMTPGWDDKYSCWRYILEGSNLSGKWMRAILAHNTVPSEEFVAINGFRVSRKRKKS
jgi:hypothetical protein